MSSSQQSADASAVARTGPLAHGMAATPGGGSRAAASKLPAPRLASGAGDLRERLELETLAHDQCASLLSLLRHVSQCLTAAFICRGDLSVSKANLDHRAWVRVH